VAVALSVAYRLTAPYPNPVRGQARLGVLVARSQQVRVEVFDALGRRVAVLFEGALESGSSRSLSWDSGRVPSGLYVVRAVGETFTAARTLTVVQ
ncbi:MAG: T9SS type A sorting domain-containing protein, partial [Rhodothermales bacterium]|nr:T9SS type A sorting domain-containing protein [Rhodothermales bacterium]